MIKKYFIAFLVGIVLTFILNMINLNEYIIFAIIIVVITLITVYFPLIHPVYVTKNVSRMEKFFEKNNDPFFQLYYALGNKKDEQVANIIEKLLKKYKADHYHGLFKAIECMYNQDFSEYMLVHVKKIKSNKVKNYYLAIYEIENGNLQKGEWIIEQFQESWMKYALLAELHRKKGESEAAKQFAKEALNHCRGLQKYLLYCEYKREFQL